MHYSSMRRHLLLSRMCLNQGSKYCINNGVLNLTKRHSSIQLPKYIQNPSNTTQFYWRQFESQTKISEPEQKHHP